MTRSKSSTSGETGFHTASERREKYPRMEDSGNEKESDYSTIQNQTMNLSPALKTTLLQTCAFDNCEWVLHYHPHPQPQNHQDPFQIWGTTHSKGEEIYHSIEA